MAREAVTRHMRDMTGYRHGRLTVIAFAGRRAEDNRALWRCACDCGGERVVAQNNLTRPAGTRSCGCLTREAAARRRAAEGVWNDGKSYAIGDGEHCYRNTRAWSKAVLRHYGNGCMACGWDKARCDAHHRVPKSRGGLHTISNGIVLCPNCHRVEHEKGRGD